jgi:hypothetical protein
MDKKREVSQQIDKAFYWLDKIAVCGGAVEVMAMARRELRAAQAMCNEETEKTEE